MGLINVLDILVVDDEELIGLILVSLLINSGHRAKYISSPREALIDFCSWGNYDVLISDVEMPGMTGIELAKKVRKDFPGIKVIIMSGKEENRLKAEENKFFFLLKPFKFQELKSLFEAVFPKIKQQADRFWGVVFS
jgi:DNA-binding NtrC family response regulator